MRVLVLTSTRHSIPTLSSLLQKGVLSGLVFPERKDDNIHTLQSWSANNQVPWRCCQQTDFASVLQSELAAGAYDVLVVFGFPWRIPAALLNLPAHGCYNVHFSLLPAYRGPMPVFWQIKNGEVITGVTVHRMDETFDTGPLHSSLSVPMIPGETEGLCSSRLGQLSVELVADLVDSLRNGTVSVTVQAAESATNYSKPFLADITLDWDRLDSGQILRLVDACNPLFMGAGSLLKGTSVRIVEASPTDALDQSDRLPGTVVHADHNAGLFVVCADKKIIRINIIHTAEGCFTGSKMCSLGIRPGDRFHAAEKVTEEVCV